MGPIIIILFIMAAVASGQTIIPAVAGQDLVSLPCRAGRDGDILGVEWTRDNLDPDGVFKYRGGHSETDEQHPSFQQRVDLQDEQMKDGDVSLILKNVTINDTGTYNCTVYQRGTRRMKRSADLITTSIHLDVSLPGASQRGGDEDGRNQDGSPLLAVGVTVGIVSVVLTVVGFMLKRRIRGIYYRHKLNQSLRGINVNDQPF